MGEDQRTTSRRRFLGTAAGATGVALAAVAWRPGQAAAAVPEGAPRYPQPAGTVRSYVTGNFFLELDAQNVGVLRSTDGGATYAEVINEKLGPTYFAKKHIGQPKYEDFSLQLGFAMNKAVYDWIAASWQANYQRKNGAIIAADYKLEAKSRREFFNALITETGIPACDAGSKEPGYLTLNFAPEYARDRAGSGKLSTTLAKGEQKLWLPSNFRLTIAGLDCTKVSKIDAFTVKQTVATDDLGDQRDYELEPSSVEFPNLTITMSEVSAQSWYDWFETFVIQGNNSDADEKNGTLEFLSPNRQDVLLEIKFFNLGIFKIAMEKSEANADAIKRVKAELYCERMEFAYKGGGAIR